MREIRPSGSEGGAGLAPRSYLYRCVFCGRKDQEGDLSLIHI